MSGKTGSASLIFGSLNFALHWYPFFLLVCCSVVSLKDTGGGLLLGITKDNKLTSKNIKNLSRENQYKDHALIRIRKYLSLEKVKLLANVFIERQVNNAPLISVFRRKTLYAKNENFFTEPWKQFIFLVILTQVFSTK